MGGFHNRIGAWLTESEPGACSLPASHRAQTLLPRAFYGHGLFDSTRLKKSGADVGAASTPVPV